MSGNGHNPEILTQQYTPTSVTPEVNRIRASGPILLLAMLFVVGAFLSWYFSWFGRELSDEKISEYIVDEKHPRRVQHALSQIQKRMDQQDPDVKHWYPQVLALANHTETEFRLTVSWLMGFDNQSKEFHQALLGLVADPEPIVRRNAALALVRFNDSTGRRELLQMLQPYSVHSPAGGFVSSTLDVGSVIARGALVARVNQGEKVVEVRSPLAGKIDEVIRPRGTEVKAEDSLLTVKADEDSVWEALRGLSLIGEIEDLALVSKYQDGTEQIPERIKQQAALTAKAIQSRNAGRTETVKQ